ncbi:hypothetical protein ALP39_200238 [Pseudomonas marginalis pv. marginalis]|nr:hypothetical protein ALP39_200238 [Pseudomonas marginalis pv. marginalis]
MTLQASQAFASRLGYGLGRCVRFFLRDPNPAVRWMKRLVFFAALLFLSTHFFHWLAGTLLTVISMVLIVYAAAKGDFSVLDELAGTYAIEAPCGRDVFGARLDCWGRVEGEYPDD